MEGHTQSGAVAPGHIAVGKAPHIVYTQAFQQVVYTRRDFHIRASMHLCKSYIRREFRQPSCVDRVVLVRKMPQPTSESHHLSQLQLLQQRHIIEQRAVGPIGHLPATKRIAHKLHRSEKGIALRLDGIGQVGVRREQSRKRHGTPYMAALYQEIGKTESRKPKTFLQRQFCLIDAITAPKKSTRRERMAENNHRRVKIYRNTR